MKEQKIKRILKSKKGETLIEGIASILVFAILMITVAAIIGASIKMTQNANAKTSEWQENAVNSSVTEAYNSNAIEVTLSFAFESSSGSCNLKQNIVLNKDGEIFSFYPVAKP